MSLKNKISDDLKAAMKEKNTVKLSILRVLKAEIQRAEQTSEDLPDAEIEKLAKKISSNIKETGNDKTETGIAELKILNQYYPAQLSEEMIRKEIEFFTSFEGNKNMKEIMKHFSSNYAGLYDGKQVSSIAKEFI